ncbi:MAG: hypothetical protein R3D98_09095 [Candidatus Krumholzibacteriia bacterium]
MRPRHCSPIMLTAVLAGVMLLLAGRPAAAQQNAEQLADFIERTAEIVDWAAEQVKETENQQAHRVLQEAQSLHLRSRDQAERGHVLAAFALSRRARDAAQHAVRLARDARGAENRVQLRLEHFLDYRDQILDRAREAGDERALRFVREAEEQALRARDHDRQGNYDLADHFIGAAEDLLARAARLLFEGGGPERLEREIERTRRAIDGIADRLAEGTPDGAATDLLESARAALERAEEFGRRGQPLRALQSVRLARRLAGQAAEAGDGNLDADTVQVQIDRWDGRYEQISGRVEASGAAAAVDALARARHHRQQAATLLAAGNLEPSLRQIKAAFDLLNEALELTR